jgi:ABC-type lipoprotein export system ATPase subunit
VLSCSATARRRATIVLVTHEPEVEAAAGRRIALADGHLVAAP